MGLSCLVSPFGLSNLMARIITNWNISLGQLLDSKTWKYIRTILRVRVCNEMQITGIPAKFLFWWISRKICRFFWVSNKFPSVGATVAAIDSTTKIWEFYSKISTAKFENVKVSFNHDPQFFP